MRRMWILIAENSTRYNFENYDSIFLIDIDYIVIYLYIITSDLKIRRNLMSILF